MQLRNAFLNSRPWTLHIARTKKKRKKQDTSSGSCSIVIFLSFFFSHEEIWLFRNEPERTVNWINPCYSLQMLQRASALSMKSTQVLQLQSEKRHIAHPKQTQEVQPLHDGARGHPLRPLRLDLSSSSSQAMLFQDFRRNIFRLKVFRTPRTIRTTQFKTVDLHTNRSDFKLVHKPTCYAPVRAMINISVWNEIKHYIKIKSH